VDAVALGGFCLGWRETRLGLRFAAAAAVAALAAGCFQPMYGERSPTGGPALRDHLGGVNVVQIAARAGSFESRLAVEIRNELLFSFTGGGDPRPQTHQLRIQMAGNRATVSLDNNTALPNIENYTLNAIYSLTEIGTGKVVVQGRALATVSYDPPGSQRFARITALQDAERRTAKTIADNISSRIASYFVAGT